MCQLCTPRLVEDRFTRTVEDAGTFEQYHAQTDAANEPVTRFDLSEDDYPRKDRT